MAIAAVVFLGLAVVMLAAVVPVRAFRQVGTAATDAEREATVQVAEWGIDY